MTAMLMLMVTAARIAEDTGRYGAEDRPCLRT